MCLLAFVYCFCLFISGAAAAAATSMKRHLPEDTSTATAAKKPVVEKPVSNDSPVNLLLPNQ